MSTTPLFPEIKALFRLAVPLIISLFIGTLVGLIDTKMAAHLGEDALAAISLTYSGLIIFYCLLYGMMAPLGILTGQAFGAKDTARAGSVLRSGLILAFCAGVISMLLMTGGYFLLPHLNQPAEVVTLAAPYWFGSAVSLLFYNMRFSLRLFFESINRPWIGMKFMLIVVATKYALNLILIPRYGLQGAGLATMGAEATGFLTLYAYFRLAPWCAAYRIKETTIPSSLIAQIRDGLPMAWQYLLEGAAVSMAGVMVGWAGATMLAANQIALSVVSSLYMLPLGIAAATSIRIAQAFGSGEKQRLRAIGIAGMSIVTCFMAGFTVLFIFAGENIARTFLNDPQIVTLAGAIFVSVGIMQIADGIQSVALGVLRGILDVRWSTTVSLIAYWCVGLPLGYVLGLPLGLGAAGVWLGVAFGIGIAAILLARRFWQKTA